MELSQNAMAFSIESLMSTSSIDDDHDRCRSAEIFSHAVDSKQKISVQDKAGNTDAPSSSIFRGCFSLEVSDFIRQRSVRPKIKQSDYLHPAEHLVSKSNTNQGEGLECPPDPSRRRLRNSDLLFGSDYKLQEPAHGETEGKDPPPGDGSWETGDGQPFDGGDLLDEPISEIVHGIQVTLENSSLWKMFNKCGTEMIVNRIGRRMFPCIVTTIRGMEPTASYRIQMELDSSDRRRYKFINGRWLPVGIADHEPLNDPYEHPDSPSLGAFWMQDTVSFAKLKITNNKETGAKTNTILHSMHRYTPRIIITKLSSADTRGISSSCPDPSLSAEGGLTHHHHQAPVVTRPTCFEFKETAFIAVTAYHSEQITQLKIQNNPFAKAFRDADVTAILQGAYMLSGKNELRFPQVYANGLMSKMHPHVPPISMEWQNPSSILQNQLDPDTSHFNHTPNDAPYRQGGPTAIPEIPDTPWSFDNVASLCPSGTYTRGMKPNAEATSPRWGLTRYHSGPTLNFDTASGLSVTSSIPVGHRYSASDGALRDIQQFKVNRSLSHPEINFEGESAAQPTSTTFQFSKSTQAVDNYTGGVHTIRRVSSATASRSAKRHSLPYLSPKKVVFLPRYRSADSYTFQKSHDQQAHM